MSVAARVAAWVALAGAPALGFAQLEALPFDCDVPDALIQTEAPLPALAKRLRTDSPASIVVLGSGSSAGSGVSTPEFAYPNRLAGWLQSLFPNARLKVDVVARRGMTARDMLEALKNDIVRRRPALVVWQTGATDAVRGVSPANFGDLLDEGIRLLHRNRIDVVLVDTQYSPYTEAFVNVGPYRDYLLWTARRHRVPLFRRHDIMASWYEQGQFDLTSRDKTVQLRNADRIHDCLAALMSRQIGAGVKLAQDDESSRP
ncbi:MAG TPA: SGNH/GDSL hydrolase family protein [Burkholderiaceae bacterium]|nr:SGNH/GDSL hydrolase family protein [Burkholderiaceae bacterium]